MKKPKNLRAIDQISFTGKNRKDFTTRKHGFKAKQIYTLILTMITIAVSVAFLVYNDMKLGSIICAVVGLLLFVVGKQSERHKKALETTEFLNALFSSIISSGYRFCILVKQDDGQIVYLNNGFQRMFPDMIDVENRTLDLLLKSYNAPKAKRSTIMQAIKNSTSKELNIEMESGAKRSSAPIRLSIEPISRPAGFCLIRGH